MKTKLALVIEHDAEITPQILAWYVVEAVGAWNGALHPSDPLCSIVNVDVTNKDCGAEWQRQGDSRYDPNVTW